MGIPITNCLFDSDHGAALMRVSKERAKSYFVCLRHLIISLRKKIFSQRIDNLMRRRCLGGFQALAPAYSQAFANATGSAKAQPAEYLGNVGLCAHKVSVMPPVGLRMPLTTTSLECTHRHFNEANHFSSPCTAFARQT
jgi:hypothetical protein